MAEVDVSSILEVFSSLQGGGKEIQAEFRTLDQEEKDLFVYTRLLRILSGAKNPAWNAANELDGLNYNVGKKSIYVSNMMNGVKFLANAMGVAKADIDLPDLEQQMGTTSPEDEAALQLIKIPFEWQQEPGGEVIKTEVGLWDVLSVWLDVNTMREFEQFVEGDVKTIRRVLEGYYSINYPDREKEIDNLVQALRTGEQRFDKQGRELAEDEDIEGKEVIVYPKSGDKIVARDLAFDAIIMRRVLKFALGLGERDRFPGLPEYTSLLTPIGFPVENLRYDPRIKDPEGTQTSYLWDALGPLVFAAEGVAGVTGDYQILRQDISVWLAMQSQRSFITKETYETDSYATTSYLAADILEMSVIYDALLHRLAEKGVEETATQMTLKDARNGAERRLNKEEVGVIKDIITTEVLFDPRGLSYMVSQVPSGEFERFLSQARKMMPRGPSGKAERRARPIGTWGRVARSYVDSHPEIFGGRNRRFENVDFLPWMEQLGIRGHLLEAIRAKAANAGGHIGKEGLVTLLEHAGLRVAKMPYIPRLLRNWFHYAKSVDVTLEGNIKPATEIVFQSNVGDVDLQRIVDYKALGKWFAGNRGTDAVVKIERDVAGLLARSMRKMADPENAAAFRFKEGPEETSYVIEQSLLAMIQAHLVFPVDNTGWMHSVQMKELCQVIPSAGFVMEPDWDDFVESGGKQLRPKRITKNDLAKIASRLKETVDQRERAFLDMGYYWMPWKSRASKGSELVLHHPTRKPVRNMVSVPEFLRDLRAAVDRLEAKASNQGRTNPNPEVQQRILRYRSLTQARTFSPVHLEGIYAFPGEAWRAMLSNFEDVGSGTPFLKSGDLDTMRAVITLFENAGILPSRFTTVREYDLERNRIDPNVLKQAQKKVLSQLGLSEIPVIGGLADPYVVQGVPGHLRVKTIRNK